MKWVDEKGKLFGKVNLFDLLVLLALIAAVCGIGLKMIDTREQAAAASKTKTWIVTCRVPAVDPAVADAFGRDTKIVFDTVKNVNASIQAVRSEPASVTNPNADGQAVRSADPYLVDVYVDLKVEDLTNDDMLKIANTAVEVGSELYLKTFYAFGKAMVVDIQEP